MQANPSITHVITSVAECRERLAGSAGRPSAGTTSRSPATWVQYQNFANIEAGTESLGSASPEALRGYNFLDLGLHGMAGKKAQYKTGRLRTDLPRDQGQHRVPGRCQRQRRPRMTLRTRATTPTCTPALWKDVGQPSATTQSKK